jgi:hypothetical protein
MQKTTAQRAAWWASELLTAVAATAIAVFFVVDWGLLR